MFPNLVLPMKALKALLTKAAALLFLVSLVLSTGSVTEGAAISSYTPITVARSNDHFIINQWNGSAWVTARIDTKSLAWSLATNLMFTNWTTGCSNGAGFTGTSYSNLFIGSTLSAPTTRGASIGFPDRNGVYYLSGARLWDWNDHFLSGGTIPRNEFQFEVGCGAALTAPNAIVDPENLGWQLGYSGQSAEHFRFQYDSTNGAPGANFGKLIKFVTRSGAGNTFAYSAIRAVAVNTTATSNSINFYSPAPLCLDNTGGTLQFSITPTGIRATQPAIFDDRLRSTNYIFSGKDGGFQIGGATPGLDVSSGLFPGVVFGGDLSQSTRTASTQKYSYMAGAAYDNSTPIATMGHSDASGTSELYLGGGTGSLRAQNTIRFYAAASHNGTTGTEAFTISSTGVQISGGTLVKKILSATGVLDFASTAAQNSRDLTITVTGAADGDPVKIGVPNGSVNANTCFTAFVSAANTVTVRFNNYSSGAVDPASGTFRAEVTQY